MSEKNDTSWSERTYVSMLSEVNESKKVLGTIRVRRWKTKGYVSRHADELLHISGEDDWQKRPETTKKIVRVETPISNAGLKWS